MKDLICPYCEKTHSHQELGKEKSGGIRIKCGYCKKEWVESINKGNKKNETNNSTKKRS